jgi:hypothetical protein
MVGTEILAILVSTWSGMEILCFMWGNLNEVSSTIFLGIVAWRITVEPRTGWDELILDNAPSSNGWLVDLLTLKDCEPIIKEVTPMYRCTNVGNAELAPITFYRPCLNEKDNPNPVPLPERYKRAD